MAKRYGGFLSWFGRFLPAVVIMGTIFLFSATPGDELPDAGIFDLLFKKGAHMLGYALLAGSYWNAFRAYHRRGLAACFGLVLLYASSDEFHQSFVAGRHASPLDVGIDLFGAALGLLVISFLYTKKIKPHFFKQFEK